MLAQAHAESTHALHVFFVRDVLRTGSMPGLADIGEQRRQFLYEGLADLKAQLQSYGHDLLIIDRTSSNALPALIDQYHIDQIYRSNLHGFNERQDWQSLQEKFDSIKFISCDTYSLYQQQHLRFEIQDIPDQFTVFRKQIEKLQPPLRKSASTIEWAVPIKHKQVHKATTPLTVAKQSAFTGGETTALSHLKSYFASQSASSYKQTRNALMGFDQSTKFSPWLAQGSLSVIQVMHALQEYEQVYGANESTYWIYFELLWREYFYWLAMSMDKQLFIKRGRRKSPPLTSFYPDRFRSWVNGTTEWPIVNACMRELAATGFLSNRGRQLAASCLVNELKIDWRYGAAYFEQQLIDYDVGANWGNWQYLAGVGVDPRGQRRFDLIKQTQTYDPDGAYVKDWKGDENIIPTNSRDASDWPI